MKYLICIALIAFSVSACKKEKEVKKENDLGEFIEISYKRSLNTNDKYDFELKTVKRFLLKKFFP